MMASSLPMRPHSILVHGDTPGAVALARAIRQEIHAAGGQVVPVSRLDLAGAHR